MTSSSRACPTCSTPLPSEAHFCLHCGTATPTEPGVPERMAPTGTQEVSRLTRALASKYRVERVLGQGGMATVYLAEDPKHKRRVAIKVMRPELAETLGTERFLREVEIAAQLSHPNVLPVFDSGAAEGFLYYVMPYVEGESLPDRLAREKQLPVMEALRLAREVAEALGHAHERGIIHRDIKPANILLSGGHALVADFGIARAVAGGGKALTQTGLAIGTPQYMSPEQAMGATDVDGRVDIYALGCVLYEMVAGEPPFAGPTPQAIMARSLTETARPLSTTREGLAPRVGAVVARALAKSPADRFQNAAEMVEAIHAAEDQTRDSSRETAVVAPTAGKAWLVFGSVMLLALTGFVVAAARRGLPTWVLGLAAVLVGGGAVALFLTAGAEARRRHHRPARPLDGLLTARNTVLGGVAALVVWALTATMLAMNPSGAGTPGATQRVAILPFTNQGTPDEAYFADGIADEVRGKLAKLGQLTVIASTSANQYRGSAKSPVEIAAELGVDYLLIGTVRWAGAPGATRRVQVVSELVEGKTGATTWQQSFDANMSDVFQMQTSIASQVAGALGAVLGREDQAELAARPTANSAAYDLYLKGKAIVSNSAPAQREAAGYFEQAVALDSTFADAWAMLGNALAAVYSNGTREPTVAARAKEAIDRALLLAPGTPGPHVAAGRYYQIVSVDAPAAEREMNLALAASPRDASTLSRSASIDASAGRNTVALEKLARARELDPRSQETLSILLSTLVSVHRFDEALTVGSQAIALAPRDLNSVQWAALAHIGNGDLAGAQRLVQEAIGPTTSTEVVAYFAGYNELAWVLEPAERQLLLRLTPAAFDNDRAWWAQSLAIAAYQFGDLARAKAYADSGLAISREQSAANPEDPQLHSLYGVLLATAGQFAEGIREAEIGHTLGKSKQTGQNGLYSTLQLARTYVLAKMPEKAIDVLTELAGTDYVVTPGRLRLDPSFASLRGNPRFDKLLVDTPRK